MPGAVSYSNSAVLGSLICWVSSAVPTPSASSNLSTDGHAYTSHDETGTINFPSGNLLAGNSIYLLTQPGFTDYLTSTDGISWAPHTFPITVEASVSVYGGGKFVIIESGGNCLTSADGLSWSYASFPTDKGNLVSLTYSTTSGLYLWAGDSAYYMTSPDGLGWTLHSYPSNVGSGQVMGK